jgi:Zn-dependent protease
VNRGDPQSGIFLVLLLLLGLQVLNRRDLPPGRVIFYFLLSFVIATTIHEFMHAYTAWRLGDSTSQQLGRITFNPIAHFDPYGFFGMVMISLGYNFIGWGKPVPVNMNRLRPVLGKGIDGRKRAMSLIALAGPASNVVQAAIGAGITRWATHTGTDLGSPGEFIDYFVYVNMLLAAFNLIPIAPLDGSKILLGILPSFWYPILAPLERYGFMILFLLFFLGSNISDGALTAEMYSPALNLLNRILY